MLFISLLRVFTKNFESIWLIPPGYSVLKNKSADVSIIFELCYTQNLVKNYWLSLRRDLPDINNWLKLAFILEFDFWINAWWYKMVNFN
jgi:hypothetical protein